MMINNISLFKYNFKTYLINEALHSLDEIYKVNLFSFTY